MFKYYNANPNGDLTGDCVIRAISVGLGIKYDDVVKMLCKTSHYFNCDMLVKDCYSNILDRYCNYRYDTNYEYTVEEISDMYRDNIVIMRIKGHLTVSRYGNILDVWDCSKESVDTYWVVN